MVASYIYSESFFTSMAKVGHIEQVSMCIATILAKSIKLMHSSL